VGELAGIARLRRDGFAATSSRNRKSALDFELSLSTEESMTRDCAVNLDHLQTVPKGNLGPLVTTLSRERLNRIREALRFALDL
jgi:mRNA-degrading endonuclease toxin of MazEF toxin-antitoxin module